MIQVYAQTAQTNQLIPVFQLVVLCDPNGGERHHEWRGVDHEGQLLESYVTNQRFKSTVRQLLRKALTRHGRAEAIVTEGMKPYPAAMEDLGKQDRREMGRRRNNRAENSHLPFRRRERVMPRFRQTNLLQKFASVRAPIHNHVRQERHLVYRQNYKTRHLDALAAWQNPLAWGQNSFGFRAPGGNEFGWD